MHSQQNINEAAKLGRVWKGQEHLEEHPVSVTKLFESSC